jgi:alkaline phosphatase
LALGALCAPATAGVAPRNVILFIGDGMGFEQVRAARIFDNGDTAPLVFETFPFAAEVTTHNAQGGVTDSAASGTAMATGVKVSNGVISMAIPGDGRELRTALEELRDRSMRTGIVTTFTPATDATPAAFAAHEPSRGNEPQIADDYFTQTRPNAVFGRRGLVSNVDKALAAGYTVVRTVDELAALAVEGESHVAGLFTPVNTPPLPHMTSAVLAMLDNDPDGFFVMIEHEGTDTYGHANDLPNLIASLLELRDAVDTALAWAAGRDDTLILVTADHETGGGLTVTETNPQAGVVPSHTWSTGGHTSRRVPLYAMGPSAERVAGVLDNTEIFALLTTPVPCLGDLNRDGEVALDDLQTVVANYGRDFAEPAHGDFDGDGVVSLGDLGVMLGAFGASCE